MDCDLIGERAQHAGISRASEGSEGCPWDYTDVDAMMKGKGDKGQGKGFQGACYNCGEFGHSARYCPHGPGKGKGAGERQGMGHSCIRGPLLRVWRLRALRSLLQHERERKKHQTKAKDKESMRPAVQKSTLGEVEMLAGGLGLPAE